MKQIFSVIILVLFLSFKGSGQIVHPIKELSIGDTIPNITLKHLLKSPKSPVKIADLYKRGMLLIDFWATWCEPCIKEMKFLDSASTKYPNSLSVLFVGYERNQTIRNFFEHHKNINIDNYNVITDDSLFVKLFKHQSLPHNIWVDNQGIIKAITGEDQINEERISSFLAGNFVSLTFKKDIPFDFRKPMHIPDSLLQYRSIFNNHLEGVNTSGTVISSLGYNKPNMVRFYGWNLSITDLFWEAFKLETGGGIPNYNLIQIRTRDSVKFYYPTKNAELFKHSKYKTNEEWMQDNSYAYELRLPKAVKDSVFYNYVQRDLERCLNVSGKIEIRKTNCVDVTLKGNPFVTAQFRYPKISIKHDTLFVKNATLDDLFNYITLNTYGRGTGRIEPYFNSTGYSSPINWRVYLGKLENWDNLLTIIESKLKEVGFDFQPQIKPYKILILTDASF